MSKGFIPYLLVMAGVTYLIRMIPFTLVRKKIKSVYIKSFLYYVPYAVLGSMTFPYILYSTGSIVTGIAGTLVAFFMAYKRCSLLSVAAVSALVAYVASLAVGLV